MKNRPQYTNRLKEESSPYLLQHAHNPVNWQPWDQDSLDQAKKKNKLIIISVGYSACHWCHVMEHESFEDEEVAEVMNRDFISIKVDREERPDLDQVYMNAVQIMTGTGGWPMNIVALPDGRPVWGGTYFRKEQWIDALGQLAGLYKEKPGQMREYASRLEEGLKQLQIVKPRQEPKAFTRGFLEEVLKKWRTSFDYKHGGPNRAPKFMMPSNYNFLLRYAFQNEDKRLMDFVITTLDRISFGGVYDQAGGGFSRYSVDAKWHIPHFEKMLYDNAQLVSLYSQAYKLTGNNWYKEVVEQSLQFIKEELTDESGVFYSAWDADSLNEKGTSEEGAYFVWTKQELQDLLEDDFEQFSEIYNINNYGKWEKDNYVLIRTKSFEVLASELNMSEDELQEKNRGWMKTLKKERQNRSKPGLDDKSLTSWNAMMLTGYLEAYKALGHPEYLEAARKNANFILERQLKADSSLYHSYKGGKSSINAYLEDYAFCIEAFLALYEVTLAENWLKRAQDFTERCFNDFYDSNSDMFFFTSNKDEALITRPMEVTDNVIPASNSVMAKNLFKLGQITINKKYSETAEKMLQAIQEDILTYPSGYSNWLDLMLNFTHPFYEVAVTGKNAKNILQEFHQTYQPNILTAGSHSESEVALLKQRYKEKENLIYVCENGSCQLPLTSVEEAMKSIKQF
ncbi:thioredoxin domain-containing protein [Salegentibacter chungangensis]|uniref:Thioredoxin domain-containing protein n=1 Tax=Salegentibacter chungangensis TaxID=1335724 RepID=A0ABW3NLW3_9FLAO